MFSYPQGTSGIKYSNKKLGYNISLKINVILSF